mgnify:FL=1
MKRSGIYLLIDPITNDVRYIGKSVDIRNRLYFHFSYWCLQKERTHKANWLRHLHAQGLKPNILIREYDRDALSLIEQFWIAIARNLGCRLTNHTDGGEGAIGARRSKETRERIRRANLGRKQKPESRAKISEGRRLHLASHPAWRHTKSSRGKISKAKTGKQLASLRGRFTISGT